MNRFTMTHEFNCSVDTYWTLNFDKEMNTAMFLQALRFPDYKIDEQRETDTEIFRRTIATPTIDAPAAVQKVLGSSFRYTEESRFDKRTKVCRFKGVPSVMTDKLLTDGVMRVEPLGDKRCRRVIEITSEAKIFGLGGLFESTAEKNIRTSYDKSAVFVNKWIADKGLT